MITNLLIKLIFFLQIDILLLDLLEIDTKTNPTIVDLDLENPDSPRFVKNHDLVPLLFNIQHLFELDIIAHLYRNLSISI